MPFLTSLQTMKVGKNQWQLTEPLEYIYNGTRLVVPVGFITDFASVPRIPLVFSVFGDRAHEAATVHDFLYSKRFDRKLADSVFKRALLEDPHIPDWKAQAMYIAVRAWGWKYYRVK